MRPKSSTRAWKLGLAIVLSLVAVPWLGGPGKSEREVRTAFGAYRAALQARDLDALRKVVAAEKVQALEDEGPEAVREPTSELVPADQEMLGVEIDGTRATVELRAQTSQDAESREMSGTVAMVLEDGLWKVSEENWHVDLGTGLPAGWFTLPLHGTGSCLEPALQVPAHDGAVTKLGFTQDGRYLVSIGFDDRTLRVWDVTKRAMSDEAACSGRPNDLALDTDGHAVFVADAGGTITRWPLRNGQIGKPERFTPKADQITQMAMNRDGTLLATTSFTGPVGIWDVETKERTLALPHSDRQRGVAFSPAEPLLVCGGHRNTYTVWNLSSSAIGESDRIRIPKVGERSDVWCIAISPDGKYLATGHVDASITIWDLKRRQLLHRVRVRDAATRALVFSPNGGVILTAHEDGGIYYWDPETGRQLARLAAHKAPVHSLALCSSGRFPLASGSEDGQIILWQNRPAGTCVHACPTVAGTEPPKSKSRAVVGSGKPRVAAPRGSG